MLYIEQIITVSLYAVYRSCIYITVSLYAVYRMLYIEYISLVSLYAVYRIYITRIYITLVCMLYIEQYITVSL